MARKSRVVFTAAEEEQVIKAAVGIAASMMKKPRGTDLFDRAQNAALPVERHKCVTTALGDWILSAIERVKPEPPKVVSKEPTLGAFVDEFVSRQNQLIAEVQDLKKVVAGFKTLLTAILGDLNDYEPKQEEPVYPPKEEKFKIAVIGPLPDQGRLIERNCPKADIRTFAHEKHYNTSTFKGYDYIIITRHASHSHYNQAISAVGRERVFRLDTGGIERATAKIQELSGH